MDQRICSDHVSEPKLKAIIEASTTMDRPCDYCDRTAPTISAWELAEHFDTMFERFFVSTTGYDDEGWGSQWDEDPEGESVLDVLERVAGLTGEVAENVVELLGDMWFDRDTMAHQYGADPHFVENEKFDEPLSQAWQDMEQSLKYEVRYNNPKVLTLLEQVFGPILDDRIEGREGVIVEIAPGRALGTLYRARVFPSLKPMEKALKSPERELGPPPPGVGRAGRMNAKGVPVFYGAVDPEIAIAEVRPPVGSHVVVGVFEVARPLRLLDIEKLILIDGDGSLFDPATYNRRNRRDFLKKLVRKLIRPVIPEREDESYLITQAVADFLATHGELDLDGILFPSAQVDAKTRLRTDARNVVLFNKSSDVASPYGEGSPFLDQETHFQMWDYDEDRLIFDPELTTRAVNPKVRLPSAIAWGNETLGPALRLDRDQIKIHQVLGVRYTYDTTPVRHVRVEPKNETK
ncbi:RES domain-containing protein [Stenotrophomonas sp. MYb238]|uniref:RES domain-containing protein n=1 Tax=Stenotrophomonas sp. MYb238 TaxID=2040281 RepID=UPI00129138C4|nr:RES domain-containing protein [Stenotrophomonas sp. MYb238]MQP76259.1 RES domain-containing protein [Stenotrophomonas sp. MYb238]